MLTQTMTLVDRQLERSLPYARFLQLHLYGPMCDAYESSENTPLMIYTEGSNDRPLSNENIICGHGPILIERHSTIF